LIEKNKKNSTRSPKKEFFSKKGLLHPKKWFFATLKAAFYAILLREFLDSIFSIFLPFFRNFSLKVLEKNKKKEIYFYFVSKFFEKSRKKV
jgi:hypothetical protein